MTESDAAAGAGMGGMHDVGAYRVRLYAISFLANVGAGLYSFTVARVLAERYDNVSIAACAGSAMMLGYGLTAYLAGRLSDKVGRRRLLMTGGLLGTTAACWAPFVSQPFPHYALIGLIGIAAASIYPTTIGALTTGCSRRESPGVLLKFTICWNFGLMAGTAAAGYLLARGDLTAIFFGAGACMLAVAIIGAGVGRASPVTGTMRTDEEEHDQPFPVRRRYAVAGWCGLAAGTFTVGLIQFVLPSLAKELGISPESHGTMLSAYRFMSILIYILLRFTNRWRYHLWWMIAAELFGIATMAALVFVSQTWLVFAVVVCSSVFPGFLYFVAIYYGSNGFSHADRGRAGGIHETVIAVGFMVGPILSGYIGDLFGSVRVPFIVGACVIAASIVIQLIVLAPLRRK